MNEEIISAEKNRFGDVLFTCPFCGRLNTKVGYNYRDGVQRCRKCETALITELVDDGLGTSECGDDD